MALDGRPAKRQRLSLSEQPICDDDWWHNLLRSEKFKISYPEHWRLISTSAIKTSTIPPNDLVCKVCKKSNADLPSLEAPCGHQYHQKCVAAWALICQALRETSTACLACSAELKGFLDTVADAEGFTVMEMSKIREHETNVLSFFGEFGQLKDIDKACISSDKHRFTTYMVNSLLPENHISCAAVSAIISMKKDAFPLLKPRLHGTLRWNRSAEQTSKGTEDCIFGSGTNLDTKSITDDNMLIPIFVGGYPWRVNWFIACISSPAPRNFEIHLYDFTGEHSQLCFKIHRTLMAELKRRITGATVRTNMIYDQIKTSLRNPHDRAIDVVKVMMSMATNTWDSASRFYIESKKWRAEHLMQLWKLYVEELLKLAEGR